ncbi:ABC transporter ATP-binding protein [Anaeromicropila populeti]|uniref:ABC-type nitrate/sulfonate/bicarbonate transport system, ATPase component n=1 Tax=Anaeromicropila populeti TaxID=37658 RepID=A0A1I6K601_9FIRM|nr:ABC transporter ATP-binding protein [Anaeromicropila populeti]SFR86659.1 ABC-type nitrate/sulfonate/bicarbonate transport system, ATPase component [Anaeromicropila populeti]
MAELRVENINKFFQDKQVLENVSLSLHNRELVSLLGASGGGKSTLFNIISGLMCPDSGEVSLDGNTITGETGHVSYMLQKDLLFPFKTIEDNVALPLVIKGMKKREARKVAGPYFQEFGLENTEKKYPHELSGGMKQRAALLRTYLFSSKVALLDEPFSALDTITKSAMHKWYLGIMEKIQLSTLFITHDIDEAIYLSDRIYLLTGNPGHITEEIIITEKKPRGEEFLLSESFIHYKRKIIENLEKKLQ